VSAPWRPATARLGSVGRPHGLDGSFRVEGAVDWHPYARGSRLLVGDASYRIAAHSGEPRRPILRLAGVDSRGAIEELRGAVLALPAGELPEPDADAFWVFDLVGCTVEEEGRELGTVREVLERPANDVLVVAPPEGGDDVLVPFTLDAIPEVDIAARRVVVRPGLL
jgi:16S rRNA processing protein RimM